MDGSSVRRGKVKEDDTTKTKKSKDGVIKKQRKDRIKAKRKAKLKRFLIVMFLLVSLPLLGVSYYYHTLNPFIILKGVVDMQNSPTKVVKLSDKPLRYMGDSFHDLIPVLEADGYIVIPRNNRIFEVSKNSEVRFLKSLDFFGLYEVFTEV